MGVDRINEKKIQWLKLLMSLLSIFALFHWTADVLGSDRGQFGIYVGSLVVIVLIFAEKALFGKSFKDAVKSIGLAIPNMTGLLIAAAISVIMLLTIFIFASVMNTTPEFYPNWYWLVPGLFFQAGIAEEGLFRGYVFGRFAEKFPFWEAAALALVPFFIVHLFLLFTLPLAIATASILLSLVIAFPLARAYNLCGNTIWGAALIHFTVQAGVKLTVFDSDFSILFSFVWMAVCAFVPYVVFLYPNPAQKPLIAP